MKRFNMANANQKKKQTVKLYFADRRWMMKIVITLAAIESQK